jgi:hypothetical protein
VDHRAWSEGWTSAVPYVAGGGNYLLILKRTNGLVHQHVIMPDGAIGRMVEEHDWTSGWTSVCTYEVGGRSWVLMLKQSGEGDDGNNVHIHPVEADGKLAAKAHAYSWSAGWTTARPFVSHGRPYLFLHKLLAGTVHIHALEPDGSVGARVETRDWGVGWNNASFYTVNGNTYLFISNAVPYGNNAQVYAVNPNGTLGSRVFAAAWSGGWSHAEAFEVNGQPFLCI